MIFSKIKHGQISSWTIIVILVSILHFRLTTTSNPRDPGWARFCGLTKDQQYVSQDFFTDKCPGGVWLNSSASAVQWNCLCTMGSFALRFGWCKTEEPFPGLGSNGLARFTPTDISCTYFGSQQNQQIQGLQALHKWSNRYKEDGPYIWTKESGGAILNQKDLRSARIKNITLTSGVSKLYAMRANPKPNTYYSIYSKKTNRAVCLLPPNRTNTDGVLFSYKINFLWTQSENVPGRKTQPRRIPKNIKLEFVAKPGCYFTDTTYSFKAILPQGMDEYVLPKLSPPDLHPECVKCLSDQSPFVEPETVENPYPADLDNLTNLNKEVDLQSQRLAIHWGDILLRNRSNPHDMNDIQEVEILKKAAIMAYGACDMNYIPKQFYQFFLILFQGLLSESFLKYPPQAPLEDKVYKDVTAVLDTCMKKTEVYNITVENTCPPTYSEYNEPGVGYEPIETPVELMAAPDKHDYVLEFAWKLISFLHYHCYDEFKDAPFLHDMLQVQLENLFQEDLLLRWSHPSNSLRMLESIFKIHLDVVVTMINFEKCVSVANKKNKFEGWLKKPLNQPHSTRNTRRRKRSVNNMGRTSQAADRYMRRRAPMLIESYAPIESPKPISLQPQSPSKNKVHPTFAALQRNQLQSPQKKLQSPPQKSLQIKKPVYTLMPQISGKQPTIGFVRPVRRADQSGNIRPARWTGQIGKSSVLQKSLKQKTPKEPLPAARNADISKRSDASSGRQQGISTERSTGMEGGENQEGQDDWDIPVLDVLEGTDGANGDTNAGSGFTQTEKPVETGSSGATVGSAGSISTGEDTDIYPVLDFVDEKDIGTEPDVGTETDISVDGDIPILDLIGEEPFTGPQISTESTPAKDIASDYGVGASTETTNSAGESLQPGAGSKPGTGSPGGSGYGGTKPLVDFPETSIPGGSANTGDSTGSGGTKYTGSKPLLDFADEIDANSGGYQGSKPLMDFDDDTSNYDKETMGHFTGTFACLYSLTDFAAQNSEYPLYSDVCWD